tara:strand:- start:23240 stop:24496 length:1257 start_codon:yes stop_codon:yes gene_type:complete
VGFGTVGQSVVRAVADDHPSLRVTHICNRDVDRKRTEGEWVAADVVWTDDIDVVLTSDVDVVVELIGGVTDATEWISRSLEAGKDVVTANKQLLAHHGSELRRIAKENDRSLFFEASVAGGIPIIHGVQQGLAGDKLFRLRGILNGTCNYILTRMEAESVSFAEVLSDAQKLGFAEADPTEDVDGFDAQAKIAILSSVAFGYELDVQQISVGTIRAIEAIDFVYSGRMQHTIRQVAEVEIVDEKEPSVCASVRPMLVPLSSALARVEGSRNVVGVEGRFGKETVFSGFGAGGGPTAVAVVSDLESIAAYGSNRRAQGRNIVTATVTEQLFAPYYVRFVVSDRPGIIEALAGTFSKFGINIDSVLQEPGYSKAELPFVVTLEACQSSIVELALQECALMDFNVRPPLSMPMLETGDRKE